MERANDSVAELQLLANAISEAAPDAILAVRAGGEIIFANRMAERLFGYDRAELIGQPLEMLVPRAHREAHAPMRDRFERAPRVREMGGLSSLEAQRKNGETVPVEISLSPVELPQGRVTIAIVRDVTRRRQLEERLRFASTHDALTDLYNRAYLDSVRAELASAPVGVLMVDVDGLKRINDRLGHDAGDQMLRRCSVVLRASSPPTSTVVRLGGDEFVILIPDATQAAVDEAATSLRADLARHNELTQGPKLELSIGTAVADRGVTIGRAMALADKRMYGEKQRHKADSGIPAASR